MIKSCSILVFSLKNEAIYCGLLFLKWIGNIGEGTIFVLDSSKRFVSFHRSFR